MARGNQFRRKVRELSQRMGKLATNSESRPSQIGRPTIGGGTGSPGAIKYAFWGYGGLIPTTPIHDVIQARKVNADGSFGSVVLVALPYQLRKTPFHGISPGIASNDGYTYLYQYSGNTDPAMPIGSVYPHSRLSTRTSPLPVTTESQIITPTVEQNEAFWVVADKTGIYLAEQTLPALGNSQWVGPWDGSVPGTDAWAYAWTGNLSGTAIAKVVIVSTPPTADIVLAQGTLGALTTNQWAFGNLAGTDRLFVEAAAGSIVKVFFDEVMLIAHEWEHHWAKVAPPPAPVAVAAVQPTRIHDHQDATSGGILDASAIVTGQFPIARLASGTPDGTQFIKDDGTLAVPPGGGGGGISDGDKGDITVSGGGSTLTIDADVVTYAKMQNVSATDKVLGRSTAGAGDVEEIACTATGRSILDDTSTAAVLTTIGAQPLDATLTALAAYNTNGVLCQTAADTFAGRTLTCNATEMAITNPAGVAGNPLIEIANKVCAKVCYISGPTSSRAGRGSILGASTPREAFTCWNFDGAGATEYLDLHCIMLDNYAGGGLTIKVKTMAATASGQWVLQAAIRRIADDAEDLDTTAHDYATVGYNTVTITAADTVGEVAFDSITFTDGADMDSVAAGEPFVLRFKRDSTHASDTMGSDARLLALETVIYET